MSNMLTNRLKIRRRCRKCGSWLVNKPEIGATCVKCGWTRGSYTDKAVIVKHENGTKELVK